MSCLSSEGDSSSLAQSRVHDDVESGISLTLDRIGTPLPPFPQPVCGPTGSGLKRFKTIEDAFRLLVRQERQLGDNVYHQPHLENRMDVRPRDPHTSMAKCVTTSGGDNPHHSGNRTSTAVELGQLQGLPLDFHFCGSKTEAKKQAGNCWSPTPGKHYFTTWGATLEAFDNGLIEAEDDIDDLYDFLENKGVDFGRPPPIEIDSCVFFRDTEPVQAKYRYISKLEKTVKPKFPLVLWARQHEVEARAARTRRPPARVHTGFDGTVDDRRSGALSVRPRAQTVAQPHQETEEEDEIVFISTRRKKVELEHRR